MTPVRPYEASVAGRSTVAPAASGAVHRGVDVGHREVEGDRHPAVLRPGQAELRVGVGEVQRRAGDVELGVADPVAVQVRVADGVGAERLARTS